MKIDAIGARLVRGEMKGDQGQDIKFDKVKVYSLGDSPNPNHKGKEVAIFEGPGSLWEQKFLTLNFPGTFEVSLGQTIKSGKFVPVIEDIAQVK